MATEPALADRLTRAFRASAGGDAGLVHAIGQLGDGMAPDDDAALVEAVQRIRGRLRHDPLGLALTPRVAAEQMVRCLARLDPAALTGATWIDPACGTGRLLAVRPVGAPAIGWDIDPVAVEIARHTGSAAGAELRGGDALTMHRPDVDRVVWVMAPPALSPSAMRSHAAFVDHERVRRVSRGWSGEHHAGVALVARVVRDLMRPGDVLGMWFPASWLTSERFAVLRRRLAEHVDAARVVVPGAGRDTVLVAVRRGTRDWRDDARLLGEVRFEVDDADAGVLAMTRAWVEATPSEPWTPTGAATREVLALLEVMDVRLGDVFDVHDGINLGGRDARAALVGHSARGMLRPRPLLSARDVRAGSVGPPERYVEMDASAVTDAWRRAGTSLRASSAFDGPRIYVVARGGRLVAAVVDDDSVALDSLCVIRGRGRRRADDVQALCGYLNTALAAEHHGALFGSVGRARHALRVGDLRRLPLLWPLPRAMRADAVRAGVTGDASALDAELRAALARLVGEREGDDVS